MLIAEAMPASTLVIAILSATFIAIVVMGRIAAARTTARDRARGWRVRRVGRDELVYEELDPTFGAARSSAGSEWRRLELSGELLVTKNPSFVIYLENEEEWTRLPDWAQGRRDEIHARIREACPSPRYQHDLSES